MTSYIYASGAVVRRLLICTRQRSSSGTRPLSIYIRGTPHRLQSLQDDLQEHSGVPGLALLPVPAHHRHLCPGALGKVPLQLRPLLRHRHGDLHLVRLCAHSRETRTGVFLWDLLGPAREHHGTHELKPITYNSTPYLQVHHESPLSTTFIQKHSGPPLLAKSGKHEASDEMIWIS